MKYCAACGYVGNPVKKVEGSFLVELFLWLTFILPGLIYSLWRTMSQKTCCPKCGSVTMIPADSPIAKAALGGRYKASKYGQAATQERRPPGYVSRYRVAKGGEEIGEKTVNQIKNLIADGQLTLEDYYFDSEVGDWCKLECLAA